MPRNGAGTYSLPSGNPVTPGTLILASWANTTMTDVGAELTNSLARNGAGGMTGPLRLTDGVVGTPSLSFNSETTMGLYRIGAAQLGFTVGGVLRASLTSSLLNSTVPVDFDSTLNVDGNTTLVGNLAVNTNKFTVTAASGNTAVAGTLDATGDFKVNTNKFTVTAASGNTAVAGTLDATGDFKVNTNKFTVTAASGNTAFAGTLGVTGASTLTGAVTIGAPPAGTSLTISNIVGQNAISQSDGTTTSFWSTSAGMFFGTSSNHQLSIYANNAERIRVAATGAILINAPSSAVALTITGAALTAPKAVAFSATPTFNSYDSNYFDFGTMTANVTSCTINNPTAGQTITIRVKQDGTGGKTFTSPAGAAIVGAVGATASKASLLTLTYNGTDARWEGSWTALP